jgi:hypothetical protein
MIKLTNSKGRVNAGLTAGGILGAAVPIAITVATGGIGAVGIPLWIALAGAVSGLFAGNVELKKVADEDQG